MDLPPEELERMTQEQLAADRFDFLLVFNLIRREGDKLIFEVSRPLAQG